MSLRVKVVADAPNLVKANPMQKEFDGNLDLTQQVYAETKTVENPVPVQDSPKENISDDEYEQIQVTSARGKNPLADFLYHMHDRFQKKVRGEDEEVVEDGMESEAGIPFADKTLTVGPANQHMNLINAPLFQADIEEDVEDVEFDTTIADEEAGVFDDMNESDVFESKAQDSFDDNEDYNVQSSFNVFTDGESTYDDLDIEQDDDSLDDAVNSVISEDELNTKSTRDLRSSLEEAIDLLTPGFEKPVANGFPFIPMEKLQNKQFSEETIAKLKEYDDKLEDYLADEDSDYLVEATERKIPLVKKYK